MQVFCDFDGTVSVEDATDFVLSRLATLEWESIESEWKQGLIGSAECMRRQVALIRASRGELDAVLDSIAIDAGFKNFLRFCDRHGILVTIVSDGVDYFIRRILANHKIGHLPIIANRLTDRLVEGRLEYVLSSPFSDPDCASGAGVCKCIAVSGSDQRIYIGDGRSDFCVSDKPEIIFAKDGLAQYCSERGIPFIPFNDFTNLLEGLGGLVPKVARQRQFNSIIA
ncbi:MtnX-like HAD-IB family phosphatase [Rhizobium tubonense]|uniref:Phosphoserine phosphatase n=1 Tax=Rhizobium tubonense TaxID=484088 RepID=A0A2W4CHV4_9HYPH|nr:MtnX-like HAD-IB family phosphatase [Rhizobium tubonense]PZM10618.1 phosphoserine phosphatase [Rhizobium tubonense]